MTCCEEKVEDSENAGRNEAGGVSSLRAVMDGRFHHFQMVRFGSPQRRYQGKALPPSELLKEDIRMHSPPEIEMLRLMGIDEGRFICKLVPVHAFHQFAPHYLARPTVQAALNALFRRCLFGDRRTTGQSASRTVSVLWSCLSRCFFGVTNVVAGWLLDFVG